MGSAAAAAPTVSTASTGAVAPASSAASAPSAPSAPATAPAAPAPPTRLRVAVALLAVYFVWGSTYLGIRIVVEAVPPFLSAGFRFLLAGAIIYLIALARGAGHPRRAEWKPAAVTGALLLLGGNGLVSWSEQSVPSGLTALIIAIVPLWVVVLEWLGPARIAPKGLVVAGIAMGLLGVALLLDPSQTGARPVDPVGGAVLVLASFIWSVGTLYGGKAKLAEPPLLAIAMEMLAGGVILVGVGLALGEASRLNLGAVSQWTWLAFAYLVLVGALVGFTAYLWLIRNVSPALATTYAFVNPVVAVYLGYLIAAEPLTPRTVLAAAVIIAAVAIITQGRSRKAGAGPAAAPPPAAGEALGSAAAEGHGKTG